MQVRSKMRNVTGMVGTDLGNNYIRPRGLLDPQTSRPKYGQPCADAMNIIRIIDTQNSKRRAHVRIMITWLHCNPIALRKYRCNGTLRARLADTSRDDD